MPRKERRKFTDDEITRIEQLYSIDLGIEQISALLGMSDAWFLHLAKKNASVRLAERIGRAKASATAKNEFWKRIKSGDMKAIELWLKAKEGYKTTDAMELSGKDGEKLDLINIQIINAETNND